MDGSRAIGIDLINSRCYKLINMAIEFRGVMKFFKELEGRKVKDGEASQRLFQLYGEATGGKTFDPEILKREIVRSGGDRVGAEMYLTMRALLEAGLV